MLKRTVSDDVDDMPSFPSCSAAPPTGASSSKTGNKKMLLAVNATKKLPVQKPAMKRPASAAQNKARAGGRATGSRARCEPSKAGDHRRQGPPSQKLLDAFGFLSSFASTALNATESHAMAWNESWLAVCCRPGCV